ncbi:hypothetical protein AB0O68_19935 [Streptomyces sp. NPDC087512]|uniref:hypothetical protein n=1 Tax=Streptomyces sp. NPDC087512 TaxID=3155059 RepID=UPI00342484C7
MLRVAYETHLNAVRATGTTAMARILAGVGEGMKSTALTLFGDAGRTGDVWPA